MEQLQEHLPTVEVNGQRVPAFVNGLGAFAHILVRHGTSAPEEPGWYSQEGWFHAFQEIAKSVGPRTTVSQIGRGVPNHATFPPGIDGVEKALSSG